MKTILIILLTIIILFSLLTMLYITLYNKLQFIKIRVDEAQKVIYEELENRFSLLMKTKKTVEKNTKMDLTIYDNVEQCKNNKTNSYEFEKKLTESIEIIYLIKNDYPKIIEKKDFSTTIRKLNESDTRMNAAKAYYNKNNKKLFELTKKFPSNIISLIHNIKVKPYYNGNEIFNEDDDVIKI